MLDEAFILIVNTKDAAILGMAVARTQISRFTYSMRERSYRSVSVVGTRSPPKILSGVEKLVSNFGKFAAYVLVSLCFQKILIFDLKS